MNQIKETNCKKYELTTWAKVSIFCIKGGLLALACGIAGLGVGIFSKPIVREKD